MSRFSIRMWGRRVGLIGLAIAAMVAVAVGPANAALPITPTPVLTLDHLVHTSPFDGSSVSMKDNEGSAYVPQDNALWLADDDGRMVYEVNATTGALEQTFGRSTFENLPQYGGGPVAGVERDRDLESLAYDASTDTLYAFSGVGSSATVEPTAFRFTRQNGVLTPTDYQPLPAGSDFTAAAWNPTENQVYVGVRHDIHTYDYATNTSGPVFQVPALGAIVGFEFTPDGKDLYVARSTTSSPPVELLSRVDWATKTLVPGWTLDLTQFGMLDARAVTLINDQFYISDGYDLRTAGDPMSHAVFVFDVSASTIPVVAPVASFTAAQTVGASPLTMTFTDISTNSPTGWKWDFGDGHTTTLHNPTPHTYAAPGIYNVSLTVTNAAGSNTISQPVSVAPAAPTPSFTFTFSPSAGTAPLAVNFVDTSTGATSLLWDFGDGTTSTEPNPSHTFTDPGSYTVTLTATNAGGQASVSRTVVAAAPWPAASFTASRTSGRAPLRVAFTDTSAGTPTSWMWRFGDGSTSTQQNPTHRFARPGHYTVRLTASNARASNTARQVVTVRDQRAPVGRFTASHRGRVNRTRFAIVQHWLRDDFTRTRSIRRVVHWGDGTRGRAWHRGNRIRHVYHRRGTFRPSVTLFDRAGNRRVLHINRVVVRR